MNRQNDWDPDQYLKFKKERTQPSRDLVAKIQIDHSPGTILDVGCGPGNSSQALLARWPKAKLIGIDSSLSMIEQARKDYPKGRWIKADAMTFDSDIKFDLVYSNAVIHWIADHESFFNKYIDMLSASGIIAIQIPAFRQMALREAIELVSNKNRWKKETEGCGDLATYHDYRYYYDLLSDRMRLIDIWETDYVHVMPSHIAIIEWIRSTGMKPYLDRLKDESAKADFENEVLVEIKKCYPKAGNGKVLFPFRRLFLIAGK
jgi:trans-aconitate 2-methyltransferase